jgi:hypothetical protein
MRRPYGYRHAMILLCEQFCQTALSLASRSLPLLISTKVSRP